MSDIQPYQTTSPDNTETHLDQRMRYAEVISNSNMLPDKFKGNPANVLMANEIAQSMGETVWVTMTELYFVGNVPTFSAKYMRTRTRQAGHILRESYDPKTMTATCTIIRNDDPDYEHVVTWDRAKATSHGLWDKGHWKKNHELMLKNRAVSECVREACNEVMGGVDYTPEEAQNMNSVRMSATRTDGTRQGERGADAVRAALEAKRAPEPQQEPEPTPESEQVGEVTPTLEDIAAAPDMGTLSELMGLAQHLIDDTEYEPYRQAGNARAGELHAAG